MLMRYPLSADRTNALPKSGSKNLVHLSGTSLGFVKTSTAESLVHLQRFSAAFLRRVSPRVYRRPNLDEFELTRMRQCYGSALRTAVSFWPTTTKALRFSRFCVGNQTVWGEHNMRSLVERLFDRV